MTLFIQIVIMNMLIAIMSNTFDRVIENRQLAKLKLRVQVLSDFVFLLPKESKKFIYLGTPKTKETDVSANWEGKITAIRNDVIAKFDNQKKVLAKQMTLIVHQEQTRTQKDVEGVKEDLTKVMRLLGKLDEKNEKQGVE